MKGDLLEGLTIRLHACAFQLGDNGFAFVGGYDPVIVRVSPVTGLPTDWLYNLTDHFVVRMPYDDIAGRQSSYEHWNAVYGNFQRWVHGRFPDRLNTKSR